MTPAFQTMMETPQKLGALTETVTSKTVPYSVRSWGDISTIKLEPLIAFWWQAFRLGQLNVIAGPGGCGKTRLAMNLAYHQVLGLEFAGMKMNPVPLRYVFLSSENSIYRLQHDIRAMQGGLGAHEKKLLAEHIFLATLEQADDSFLSFESPENIERWRLTIKNTNPDVLVVDPWGDVQAGDANSNSDARASVQQLMRLAREAKPNIGVVVITHSRTGAANLAQAVGYNAANYMKGAKALFDCARAVVNIAPGDESEQPPVVVVSSKANDTIRFKPFALRLVPETMLYYEDDQFDFNAWRDDLEAAARGKRARGKALPSDDEVLALLTEALQITKFVQLLRGHGFSKAGAEAKRQRLLEEKKLEEAKAREFPYKIYIGLPEQIKDLEAKWAAAGQNKAA
jgi:hypothetical protein